MRRTVSKMGNSSLVMSLPHSWVKENNVKQGDELFVETFEQGLSVSLTQVHRKEKVLEIDVSNYLERSLMHLLNSMYRSGYVRCILLNPSIEQRSFISDFTHDKLLGFEVVEETKNKVVIENIAEPSTEKLDVIVRKIFLLTKQMGDDIFNYVKEDDFSNLSQIQKSKTIIDNFTNFSRRTIIGVAYGGKEKSYFLFSFIAKLSILSHAYYYLYRDFCETVKEKRKGARPSLAVLDSLALANQAFSILYEMFYHKDLSKINNIEDLRKQIIRNINQASSKREFDHCLFFCYLFELARHIQVASTYLVGYHFSQQMNL